RRFDRAGDKSQRQIAAIDAPSCFDYDLAWKPLIAVRADQREGHIPRVGFGDRPEFLAEAVGTAVQGRSVLVFGELVDLAVDHEPAAGDAVRGSSEQGAERAAIL